VSTMQPERMMSPTWRSIFHPILTDLAIRYATLATMAETAREAIKKTRS
jgi:hypothetical protein